MSITTKIFGAMSIAVGGALGYGIYWIIMNIYNLFIWLGEYIHAPESLAVIGTLFGILFFFAFFVLIAVGAVVCIVFGIAMILD